jgi:hypothetical protein
VNPASPSPAAGLAAAARGPTLEGGGGHPAHREEVVSEPRLTDEDFAHAHGLFQALLNTCRARLILELADGAERGADALAARLRPWYAPKYVGDQLRLLHRMGLVARRREGGETLYRLARPGAAEVIRAAARDRLSGAPPTTPRQAPGPPAPGGG